MTDPTDVDALGGVLLELLERRHRDALIQEAERLRLQYELDWAVVELDQVRAEHVRLQAELDDAHEQVRQSATATGELRTALAKALDQWSTTAAELAELRDVTARAFDQLDTDARRQLAELEQAAQAEITAVRAKLDREMTKHAWTAGELTAVRADRDELRLRVADLEADLPDLPDTLEVHRREQTEAEHAERIAEAIAAGDLGELIRLGHAWRIGDQAGA